MSKVGEGRVRLRHKGMYVIVGDSEKGVEREKGDAGRIGLIRRSRGLQ